MQLPRRLRRRPRSWVEAVIIAWIGATTFAFGLLDTGLDGVSPSHLLAGMAITSVLTMPLLVRHRWPRAALVVLSAGVVALALADVATDALDPWLVSATMMALPAIGVAGHAAVLDAPRGGTAAAAGSALAVVAALALTQIEAADETPLAAALVVTSWATGFALLPVMLAGQRREQERRRAVESRMRLEQARLSVARDLHDDVGHHLAAIRIQSVAARHLAARDVPAVLERIAEVSEAALWQVEGLVASLRDDAVRAEDAMDAMALPDITELSTTMRQAGVECRLDVDTGVDRLEPTVEVAARRIVQEALTNVLRHAGASHVDVVLRREADALLVRVVDDGTAAGSGGIPQDERPHAGGHGLTGMRERAQLLGGHVEAGPQRQGGWRVEARLPLAGASR